MLKLQDRSTFPQQPWPVVAQGLRCDGELAYSVCKYILYQKETFQSNLKSSECVCQLPLQVQKGRMMVWDSTSSKSAWTERLLYRKKIWYYEALKIWWSLAIKGFVCRKKNFKFYFGFNGEPMKRSLSVKNMIFLFSSCHSYCSSFYQLEVLQRAFVPFW